LAGCRLLLCRVERQNRAIRKPWVPQIQINQDTERRGTPRHADIWSGCRKRAQVEEFPPFADCALRRIILESSQSIMRTLLFLLAGGREGIEGGDYLAESKDISEIPEKVTPVLNPQEAWLLVEVLGHSPLLRLRAYPDLSFSSAYNDSSIIRSSSCSADAPAKFLRTSSLT